MSCQRATGGPRRPAAARMAALALALASAVLPLSVGAGEAEPAGEKIVRVVLRGGVRTTAHRILGQMRLREGSLYTPAAVDEDLKRIYALGEFENVVIRPEKTDRKSVV